MSDIINQHNSYINKIPKKRMIEQAIEEFTNKFLEKTKDQGIHLVSHFDTDGITSAAIFSKTLTRLNKQFSIKIIKQLTEKEIQTFPLDKIIFLLDLGSNSLTELGKLENEIFIIDHHELETKDIPENIHLINPHYLKKYIELCGAELTYLFSKQISDINKDLAYLAIIGMVGDTDEFLDLDGNKVGPFKKGDVANLSEEIANILIVDKKAEAIDED